MKTADSRGVVVRAGDEDVTERMPRQTPNHRLMSLVNTAELLLIAYTVNHS